MARIENIKLSNDFWLHEFIKSGTAARYGYTEQYNPPPEVIDNLRLLCVNILQPLRNIYGPIYSASGFRCKRLNKKIRGSKKSQHKFGMADDIDSAGKNRLYFEYIRDNLIFDQLIYEFGDDDLPEWIHVSFSKEFNRGQVLRAYRVKRRFIKKYKVIYEPYS